MRHKTIVNFLSEKLKDMRKSRIKTLGALVTSLLKGKVATLTQLGRTLPGNAKTKHKIKRVDRFMGNDALSFSDIAPLTISLLPPSGPIFIIIDWTPHGANLYQTLSAKIPLEGRCLPLLAHTHLWKGCDQSLAEMNFLKELHSLFSEKRQIIIIADKGFRAPFRKKINKLEWDYIVRLRNDDYFLDKGVMVKTSSVKPRPSMFEDFGFTSIGKGIEPEMARVVAYKAPKRPKRKAPKRKKTPKDEARYRKMSKEPWHLVTTLDWQAEAVITGYAQRFQIEESFRDWKNHQFCGYKLKQVKCSSSERLERLIVVIAVAYIIQLAWGLIGDEKGLELDFRSNRSKKRCLGVFYLGGELLRCQVPWRLWQICAAFRRAILRVVEKIKTGSYVVAPVPSPGDL